MPTDFLNSLVALKRYCEGEEFKGWDPYDGLNSRVFQALPLLKRSAVCRLVMIQGFKRSPLNLRRIAMVPKQYNAKGIGLLLQAYCNFYRAVERDASLAKELGSLDDLKKQIDDLAAILLSLRSEGDYHGACWGYNFDWQARRLFLFPKNTPTVVATTFCASALMSAYEITGNREWLDVALTSAEFVINDLHRSEIDGGFLFSYSPLEGNDTVFNASLLGSKLLALCYHYTGSEAYRDIAKKSVEACCRAQRADGAWVYGMLPVQSWVDSFHTGYNLDAINVYQSMSGDHDYDRCLEKGFEYYINNFYEADGTPKYYDNRTYPIDIHCPAQLFVTLASLDKMPQHEELARKVADWSIKHMQDKKGYFYYQLKPRLSSKISYMRWSDAFMLNAMSYYLLTSKL